MYRDGKIFTFGDQNRNRHKISIHIPEDCPLQKFWYSISKFVCEIQNLDKKYEKICKGHYDKYPLNASQNILTI